MDKISVIVPIYNVEKYIHKCVDSITNQTYKNLEIILVDDGSPDNCGEICDEYAKKDNRIRVIHKENGGLSDARNAGLDISTGEYIGFVDSDDYIAPNMYEVLYNRIKEDKTDIAVCKILSVINDVNPGFEKLDAYICSVDQYFADFKFNFSCCNRLFNKKLWSNIRFPVGKLHEDAFVEHLIVGQCDKISCVNNAMYFYFKRNESIMTSNYSSRRLDCLEAYLHRINYMISRNFYDAVQRTFELLISGVFEARKKLDLSNKQNKKILLNYEKDIKHIFFSKVLLMNMSLSVKFKFLYFCISPCLYSITYYRICKLIDLIKGKA